MSTHEDDRGYDVIFAGGGTAACVAAGRLAQADPNLSILIIERGKNNLNDPMITNPGIFVANLAPSSTNMVWYQAESEPALSNRARVVPTGGILGGGSSTNAMMYVRAQAVDFDGFQMEGWDSKSLIACAKKEETMHTDDQSLPDESIHGTDGPINVSNGQHVQKSQQDDFLAAAKSYDIPEIADLQDFNTVGGFSRSKKYIGLDGKRQDAAHQYVHPLMADGKHPNLHLLVETKVNRVLFEDNRAVGVEYEAEPIFLQQSLSLTQRISKTVKARKLVVVSAGALGTPSILERSGVGSKDLLSPLGIPVISDLPGVGENYQDHHFLLCTYKTNLGPDETMDALLAGRRDFMEAVAEKDTILGWNGIDIAGKLRMTDEEAAALGPEFKEIWDRDFASVPTKPIMCFGTISFYLGDHKMINAAEDGTQFATVASYTPYPYSRGSVHITSADCTVAPRFLTGFLADENDIDLKKTMWAYKKGRDIYRRTNAFAGELALGQPKFREGSAAALSSSPFKKGGFQSDEERKEIPPIKYDEEDDRAIEDFIRSNVGTTFHSLGTCKMAPKEKLGVVDESLNVYGTEALKCVDLSIIPNNVGANTNNTALIVGEKAAEIIARELGI
ncbi:alcohol oxidase [Corynespora cassiicola Philippines]|uniref:Alcohol oxidase n=1 Tax=Corynespora cassiicola Philippines TaxID=1448308 RepID=A0A2T2P9I6_CORCC|nr:alcohol oxidase [Corynespora cassiicola Philippines]